MDKPTRIRSQLPHEVTVADGSNVAKRKTAERKKPVKTPPPEVIEERIVAAEPPAPARARAKLKKTAPAAEIAPKSVRSSASAPPAAAFTPGRPLSPAELWSQDSPVAMRLDSLKSRNSELHEQIDRLTESLAARGKTA